MKKIFAFFLALTFVLSLFSCSVSDNGTEIDNADTPNHETSDNTPDNTVKDDGADNDITDSDNTDDTVGDDNTNDNTDDSIGDSTTDDNTDSTDPDDNTDDTTDDNADDNTESDNPDDKPSDDKPSDNTDEDKNEDSVGGDGDISGDNTENTDPDAPENNGGDNVGDDNKDDENGTNNKDDNTENEETDPPIIENPVYIPSFTENAPTTKVLLNDKEGWSVLRGRYWILTDSNRLMFWPSSDNDLTYDWPAINTTAIIEGTISAKVSANGNVGIFFGGSGMDKSIDGGTNPTVTNGIYCSSVTLLVDAETGAAYLEFYYDDSDVKSYTGEHKITVPLNDTRENTLKYGMDGSDVTLTVKFTKGGKVSAFVNGVKALETSDNAYPTFGDQHGIIVRSAYCPKKMVAGYVKDYSFERLIKVQNATFELSSPTTLLSSGDTDATVGKISSTHYPSMIELKYQKNPEDNGKLIAHFRLGASKLTTNACFMQSTDGGKTWTFLSMPTEQDRAGIADGLRPGQMAHLYELPAQIGIYPAGTLVYSSGSINYSVRSEIWVWYSTDCGKTWKQTSKVAEGGSTDPVGDWPRQSGVWEPFTWYDNGYLYCFYSDDSDPKYSQKLVYKRSSDGVNWENLVHVCAFSDPTDRPGMFIMTKMGNGEYFMVYEFIGEPTTNNQIYYKKTRDISSWNPSDPGKKLCAGNYSGGSAPSCIWVPAGGECGTLIASAMWEHNGDGTHKLFVSFDYGESWTTMDNPLPYTTGTDTTENGSSRIGYSPAFELSSDGHTVYYMNTTNVPETGKRRMQFATITIY